MNKRIAILRLMHKHDGKCTSCGCRVMVVRRAIKAGWVYHQPSGLLVGPRGETVAAATIEHVIPLGKGGTNDPANLTLYCHGCNNRSSHFGMKMRKPSEAERTESQ